MKKGLKSYFRIYLGIKFPWFLLVLYIVLALIQTTVEVNTITLTASIIDASQSTIKTDELIEYIFYIVLSGALSLSANFISGVAYQRINLGVRPKLWRKVMHLPISANDKDNGAELITRVTTDADSSSDYFSVLIALVTTIYAAVIALDKMFQFNKNLSWYILMVIPYAIGFSIFYSKLSFKAGRYSKTTLASMMSYLAERVRNFRLIKSSCTEDAEFDKGNEKIKKTFRSSLIDTGVGIVGSVGNDVISLACLIISFVMGGKLVGEGVMTVGKVIGFYGIAGMLCTRIIQLIGYIGTLGRVNGTMVRIASILDMKDESEEGTELDEPDEDIVLSDVRFGYNEDEEILHGVNCTIEEGRITAIVGPNGAGKTTMFKLIERMYEPTSGEILYGKTDCKTYNLDSWRKTFGIVNQEDMVMSGTVRENILYGIQRHVSEDELIAVAKKANVYDFVMETPNGFDTEVGVDGKNFSGGQRQCIAIARAMMRNPDYLLLDESTSNLDVKSESIVSAALANLMRGRTAIMIAHNYSATLMADRVIVMNNGTVEADGTPEELLKTNRYYQVFAKGGV